MAASPNVLVREGLGPWVSAVDGVDVSPGSTISLKLESISEVSQWFLEIFGSDELTLTYPPLSGVGPDHIVATPSTVVQFTMPGIPGEARALIFRSVVNGLSQFKFGIYTPTSLGFRVGAVGETFEGSVSFGWAKTVNPLIRSGGGGLPPLAVEQYAALMEDPAGHLIFQRINQDMILPAFSVVLGKTAPGGGTLLYRRGDTISGITATASYVPGLPTTASIANSFGGSTDPGDLNPGSWSLPGPSYTAGSLAGSVLRNGSDLGADPTMTAQITAIKGVTRYNSFIITWTSDVYYGVGPAGYHTEAEIESLTSQLSPSRTRTITVSPSTQKVYYAYPKALGTSTFTLNGFPAAFNAPTEVSVTNVNGVTRTYYLYESTNLLLGSGLNFIVI